MNRVNPRLYTIPEYTNFITRRWRFIAGSTLAVTLIMGVVSFMLPDIYSSSIMIDAGTRGLRSGAAIDAFRNGFNGAEHRNALPGSARERVTQVWMDFRSPNITIRVDALDGPTAAAAAAHLGNYVIAKLMDIPVFWDDDSSLLAAGDAQLTAIHFLLETLEHRVGEELDKARAAETRLVADRDRILASTRVPHGGGARATAEGSRLADRLATAVTIQDQTMQEIWQLEVARVKLGAVRRMPVPREAVPSLTTILETPPSSPESLRAVIDDLYALIGSPRGSMRPIVSPRLLAVPQVPALPSWPRPTLNLLIASLFGLVGSSFAAVLLESGPRE